MLAFLLNLDSVDLLFIALGVIGCVLIYLVWNYLRQRETSLLPARKVILYVAFLALGALFIFLKPLFLRIAELAYGAHDAPGAVNASTATIEAAKSVGGWVPLGTATSKILLVITFYVLSYILPWVVQQVTHPVLTAWAKDEYKADFPTLPVEMKFENNARLGLNQSIRLAASIVGACLIA